MNAWDEYLPEAEGGGAPYVARVPAVLARRLDREVALVTRPRPD